MATLGSKVISVLVLIARQQKMNKIRDTRTEIIEELKEQIKGTKDEIGDLENIG
jgi:hypothetical protein